MNRLEIVHIAPNNEAWRVYRAGETNELSFDDLGAAFDAASRLVADGVSMRIVIHDRLEVEPGPGSAGVSAAA